MPQQSLYEFDAKSLEGAPAPLSAFKGKVALVVNTASKCGKTPQYKGLEALYEKKKDEGFVILGFPSNDFLWQEPGDAAEIRQFCTRNYGVTFPLFEKGAVKGADQQPIFTFLSQGRSVPDWNFHKYLVGKDGKVIAAFKSSVQPDAPELLAAIDAALKAP